MPETNGVLEAISRAWQSKIRCAKEHKRDAFGDRATECMAFYDSPNDVLYTPDALKKSHGFQVDPNIGVPRMRVRINKIFEAVTLLLPIVMHRNPVRTATPSKHRLPETVRQVMAAMGAMSPDSDPIQNAVMDARAWFQEHLLNSTPVELDLKGQSRMALVEAFVKGRGLLWTTLFPLPTTDAAGSRYVPGSEYVSVDNLLLDPDGTIIRECGWAARRRIQPVNDAEDRFGIKRGTLKGNRESLPLRAYQDDLDRTIGGGTSGAKSEQRTQDLVEYWEIYSRIGLGGRLFGAQNPLKDTVDAFGRNVFLCIADNVNWPLNLPADMTADPQELQRRLAWPIPVHDDPSHPWPFVHCDFAHKPNSLWPVPWFWPSMGLQRMISWLYSFMCSHVQVSTRQLLVGPEDLQEDVEEKILHGVDFELLKVARNVPGNLEQVLQFIQHPELNRDLWEVLQAVNHEWERSTGISELLHGYVGGRQMRSAEEASIRSENTMLRPDDMSDVVEDWQSLAARNEGVAWRLLGTPREVAPIFGETFDVSDPVQPRIGPYTAMWGQILGNQPPENALYEFEYRIASGSARKPNRAKQQQDIDESAQIMLPTLMQDYQQWGDPSMVNSWLRKWAETREFDPGLLQFPDRRPQILAMQMQQMGIPTPEMQAMAAQAAGQQGMPVNPEEQQAMMAAGQNPAVLAGSGNGVPPGGGMM